MDLQFIEDQIKSVKKLQTLSGFIIGLFVFIFALVAFLAIDLHPIYLIHCCLCAFGVWQFVGHYRHWTERVKVWENELENAVDLKAEVLKGWKR